MTYMSLDANEEPTKELIVSNFCGMLQGDYYSCFIGFILASLFYVNFSSFLQWFKRMNFSSGFAGMVSLHTGNVPLLSSV